MFRIKQVNEEWRQIIVGDEVLQLNTGPINRRSTGSGLDLDRVNSLSSPLESALLFLAGLTNPQLATKEIHSILGEIVYKPKISSFAPNLFSR